jgi:hypothetical protein
MALVFYPPSFETWACSALNYERFVLFRVELNQSRRGHVRYAVF